MKKLVFFLICAALLLISGISEASAAGEMVMIPAGFSEGEYSTSGDSHNIGFAFIAADQDLVQEFIDTVNFNVTFTDEDGNVILKLTPEVVRQLWSEPSRTYQSSHNLSPLSRAYWTVPLMLLPPGDYTMRTVICMPHSVTTGYDANGDGKEEVFLPEDCNRVYVVHIHIAGTEKSKLII